MPVAVRYSVSRFSTKSTAALARIDRLDGTAATNPLDRPSDERVGTREALADLAIYQGFRSGGGRI